MSSKNYEVGYGKPPKHSQFKPGRSGNPKGRPKGARGLKTDLKEELRSRVKVTENGQTTSVSKQQLVIKALFQKAIKGDVRAAERIMAMIIQVIGIEDEGDSNRRLSKGDAAILEDFLGGLGGSGVPVEGGGDNVQD